MYKYHKQQSASKLPLKATTTTDVEANNTTRMLVYISSVPEARSVGEKSFLHNLFANIIADDGEILLQLLILS